MREPDAKVFSWEAPVKLCKSRNRYKTNEFICLEFWHTPKFYNIPTQHNSASLQVLGKEIIWNRSPKKFSTVKRWYISQNRSHFWGGLSAFKSLALTRVNFGSQISDKFVTGSSDQQKTKQSDRTCIFSFKFSERLEVRRRKRKIWIHPFTLR